MIWDGEYSQNARKRFAWVPTEVDRGEKVVWLQSYWIKFYPKGTTESEYDSWRCWSYNPDEHQNHETS